NDIAIPITVLEELDNFKKGNDTKNFEAREFIRIIDKLSEEQTLQDWIPLNKKKKTKFKILLNTHGTHLNAETIFDDRKNDHKILNAALSLQEDEKKRQVILVSKDINLRLKAKALSIVAEDYRHGKIKDASDLHTGMRLIENLPSKLINEIYEKGYVEDCSFLEHKDNNHFYILKNGKSSSLGFYNPVSDRIERVEKLGAYGIKARNAEQAFALHAILNPDIK